MRYKQWTQLTPASTLKLCGCQQPCGPPALGSSHWQGQCLLHGRSPRCNAPQELYGTPSTGARAAAGVKDHSQRAEAHVDARQRRRFVKKRMREHKRQRGGITAWPGRQHPTGRIDSDGMLAAHSPAVPAHQGQCQRMLFPRLAPPVGEGVRQGPSWIQVQPWPTDNPSAYTQPRLPPGAPSSAAASLQWGLVLPT